MLNPRIMYIKDESILSKHQNAKNGDNFDGENEEDLDFDEDDGPQMVSEPFMMTEQGPVSVKHYMPDKEVYNLWIAHTNFHINEDIFHIIDNVVGGETFELISPYRFRIGIGKLFIPKDVFTDLNKQIFAYLKPAELTEGDEQANLAN